MLKHLLKDSIIYGLSNLVSRGMGIILVPIYTRVMSPQVFGAFDLLLTFGAIANLVVALEVSQGQARFWNETNDKTKLASTVVWFTVFMYLIFALISLIYAHGLSNILLGTSEYLAEFKIGVLFIAFNGVYQVLLSQLRWELKSKTYATVSLLQALTLMAGVFFCYHFALGLEGILIAQIFALLIATTAVCFVVRNYLSFTIDLAHLGKILSFSLPLVPAAIGTFIYTHIGRIFLNNYHGLEQVGQLGLAMRISGVVVILFSGVRLALTPLIYKHHNEKKTPTHLAYLFNALLGGALILCLTVSLFSEDLIRLLATTEYSVSAGVIGLLTLSVIIFQLYIFFPGVALKKKTRIQLYISLITAIVCLIANWILTSKLGVMGVAISSLLSSLMFIALWVESSQKFYFIPISRYKIIATIAMLTCIIITKPMLEECINFDLVSELLIIVAFTMTLFSLSFFGVRRGASIAKPPNSKTE